MQILLIVHQFFPEFTSGTEVLANSVARELAGRGHQVRIFTAHPTALPMSDEERFDEYQYEGIHVYRFYHSYVPMAGQSSMVELSFDNHLAASYFKKVLDGFKPDVVHFFHLNRLGIGLIDHAVQAQVPAFITPTDFWAICPTAQLMLPEGQACSGPSHHAGNCVKHFVENTQKGVVQRAFKSLPIAFADHLVWLTQVGILPRYPHRIEVQAIGSRLSKSISRLNKLTKIVSPNRFMTGKLTQYGVSPSQIIDVAYGIDLDASEVIPPRRLSRHPLRIGYIGTLAPHKGCHILVESFKSLPQGAAILKMYGNLEDFPEYVNELRVQAAQNVQIEFCGVFHNSKIAEVMADLDVLIVPSLWFENTPLVLYSAQAARCPVIASNFPGMSEVIQDQLNGLLFDAGNVIGLAAQLSRLINESDLIGKLSENTQPPKSMVRYVDELLSIWRLGDKKH